MTMSRICAYSDCGWCYKEDTQYTEGCVGMDNCEYYLTDLNANRMEIIMRNGNTGEHYIVEKIAKRLAGKDFDMMLSGKKGVRRRWVDFIPLAMEIIEIVESDNG